MASQQPISARQVRESNGPERHALLNWAGSRAALRLVRLAAAVSLWGGGEPIAELPSCAAAMGRLSSSSLSSGRQESGPLADWVLQVSAGGAPQYVFFACATRALLERGAGPSRGLTSSVLMRFDVSVLGDSRAGHV